MGIKILYLTGENLYREKRGKIRTDFPGSVQNESEGQMHSLVPNPVFPEMEPRVFRDWDSFIKASPPKVVRVNDKSLMVCVDNDCFPVGPSPAEDEKDRETIRKNARDAMLQEALQRARTQAERADRGLDTITVMTAAAVAGIGTIIIAFLFLSGRVG